MKNTVVTEIILNAKLMDKNSFCDWFYENRAYLLEKEKQQIIEAFSQGKKTVITEPEQYYNETFNK